MHSNNCYLRMITNGRIKIKGCDMYVSWRVLYNVTKRRNIFFHNEDRKMNIFKNEIAKENSQ